jgi:hypothetical protein
MISAINMFDFQLVMREPKHDIQSDGRRIFLPTIASCTIGVNKSVEQFESNVFGFKLRDYLPFFLMKWSPILDSDAEEAHTWMVENYKFELLSEIQRGDHMGVTSWGHNYLCYRLPDIDATAFKLRWL